MIQSSAVFVFDLVQDVTVLRPLVFLAARETEARLRFLVSGKFARRDPTGTWREELASLAQRVQADVSTFEGPADAFMALQGGRGVLIASSESDLPGHSEAHNLMRAAPPGYLRVTLQHGLECVGFFQNRAHDLSHGRRITFAADVLCTWMPEHRLSALVPSQRSKVMVTGPSFLLSRTEKGEDHPPARGGIVCENLHSVRLRASGDHGQPFMETFRAFSSLLGAAGEQVTLRPHPAGRYVLRNNVVLPPNVVLNNLPLYRVDLSSYDYGISAPSTVVLDMVLAGIPVGVWQDPDGVMDLSNYEGLTRISDLEDWVHFLRDARLQPESMRERQQVWLKGLEMPLDPSEIYRRFARLIVNAARHAEPVPDRLPAVPRRSTPQRVLFIANGSLPTLQLCFHKPLAALVTEGRMETLTITLDDMKAELPAERQPGDEGDWFRRRVDQFAPDLVVACRYNGPGYETLTEHLKARGIPFLYHIDDDLLNVPREIGEKKFLAYQRPELRASLTHQLRAADLVYTSTAALKRRLRELGFRRPMVAGDINCASEVINRAERRPVRKIGYMGFDHAHDFQIALPAVVRCLNENPELTFDLFGSIPMPPELSAFGDRVRSIAPVRNYEEFLKAFAALDWDIGICPLAPTLFNSCKSNNKWIEYTAVGAAVVATAGTIYDDCGSDGCAILVDDAGWYDALQSLVHDPEARFEQVVRAQQRLEDRYSTPRLTEQVLEVFELVANETARGLQPFTPAASRTIPLPETVS